MQLASDTVVVDLGKKAIMLNLIEGFFKVHNPIITISVCLLTSAAEVKSCIVL